MLRQTEARYLARAINVSYKQLILQIGSLGWEELFLDEGLYGNFFTVDDNHAANCRTNRILAEPEELPFASESIDLVIMPHTLEFIGDQHVLLHEVDRVLKPEGQVLLLGFNPWSIYRLYHVLTGERKNPPWCGKLVSRYTLVEWLSLMNFHADVTTGFYLKPASSVSDYCEKKYANFLVIAYAIKAIKRRYTLIPLKPCKMEKPAFVSADAIETSTFMKNTWKKRSRFTPTEPAGEIRVREDGAYCCATTASKKSCTVAN